MDTTLKRVLVVGEGDQGLQQLDDKLSATNYEIIRVKDGSGARSFIEREGTPHIMVVDLRLADMSGLQLCQELYEKVGLPIITLSDQTSSEEAVKALQVSDDYVRKPFAADELAARIWRVLSRIGDFSYATGPTIQLCDWLTLDPTHRRITIDGQVKVLTPTENALLNALIKHRGSVVSADTLIQRVWRKEPTEGDRNALRVHMHRLRNKLTRTADAPPVIITERGVGYAFVAE